MITARVLPAVPPDTALVLTSCGRFDLLRRTLESFIATNTAPLAQCIVVEDSGDGSVRDVLAEFPLPFDVILNDVPRGQIASIDLAYSRVLQPWIFHCEDDWEFVRGGYIEESRVLLEAFPTITVVNAVTHGTLSDQDAITDNLPIARLDGVRFVRIPPQAHPLWFGYTFNPGLRRRSDWLKSGSFSRLGHEAEISLYFKHRGMSIAVLADRAYRHIGEDRHVDDPVSSLATSPAFLDYFREWMLPKRSRD